MNELKKKDYTITFNPLYNDNNNDEDVKDLMSKLYWASTKNKIGTIKKLKKAIQKYPNLPQFKNYLIALYHRKGNSDLARELNDKLLEKNPNYFWGKLNKINFYYLDENYDEIKSMLSDFNIKKLYPERDLFHFTEILALDLTAIRYYLNIIVRIMI
ncbi:MAG: hypothetical protein ABIA04_16445 [Pseudomonadota bacterium]